MASTSSLFQSDPMTLTRFILVEQKRHPEATGDLTLILNAIQTACKAITSAVRRAGLIGLYGLHGSSNATGDEVKKLDVIANDIFVNSLKHTGLIGIMVSEENEDAIIVKDHPGAKYAAVFDPLDGSSNIDCNVSIGSIFGIYRRKGGDAEPTLEDVLQPGTSLLVAGYAMYGSSTDLVITLGDGVHMFSYDPSIGEFLQTRSRVMIPASPQRIYSVNEGNYAAFPKGFQTFLNACKAGEKPYSLRYTGSMVADMHRTLLYGGVFAYPPTLSVPGGKLRLLYELQPMSYLIEQAGGLSTTGTQRVMTIDPVKIHQRAPIYIGCKRDVEAILAELQKA